MNKEWSEKNRKMQSLIGKKESFDEGIALLLELREDLFGQITSIVNTYPKEAFFQMPFAKAKGYHSKTLGYLSKGSICRTELYRIFPNTYLLMTNCK